MIYMANKSNPYDNDVLNSQLLKQAERAEEELKAQLAMNSEIKRRAKLKLYSWSDPQNLNNDKLNIDKKHQGIYSISHIPSNDIPVYDGVGNPLARIKKFKETFIGKSSNHNAGIKARNYDDVTSNYNVRYVMVESRIVANYIEEYFILIDHRPIFNDPKMAGK